MDRAARPAPPPSGRGRARAERRRGPGGAAGRRPRCRPLAPAATERLGGFLLLELWASGAPVDPTAATPPRVRLHVPAGASEAAEALRAALAEVRLSGVDEGEIGAPPVLAPPEVVEDAV